MLDPGFEDSLSKIRLEKDPIRKGKLLHELHSKYHLKTKDLSEALHIKPSYLCHLMRLHKIPDIVVDGYYSGLVTMTHLFIISRLRDSEGIIKAYESILSHSLSISQTEEYVRSILYGIKSEGSYLSIEEKKRYESMISRENKAVHTSIIQSRIKTKIIIEISGQLSDTTPILQSIVGKMSDGK